MRTYNKVGTAVKSRFAALDMTFIFGLPHHVAIVEFSNYVDASSANFCIHSRRNAMDAVFHVQNTQKR